MERNTELREMLSNYIESLPTDEKVALYQEYCDQINDPDNYIYSMDAFNDIMYDIEPLRIALMIEYGDFNPNHDYFKFTAYGNLESIEHYWLDDYIYIDEIVDHIIDNDDDLYDKYIRHIIESVEIED